jgi:hypothetical protein
MKGKGTNNETSPGDPGETDAAISVANFTASAFVSGFNFQFPAINGFRLASNSIGSRKASFFGIKA